MSLVFVTMATTTMLTAAVATTEEVTPLPLYLGFYDGLTSDTAPYVLHTAQLIAPVCVCVCVCVCVNECV